MLEDDHDLTDDDLAALEVIYRVMWEDEGTGLHKHVARSFRAWAQTQHPHLDVADVEGDGGDDGQMARENGSRVDLTRATRTNGGVTTTTLELTQHAALGRSVVTIRVLSGNGEAWVWVDVEAPHIAATPGSLGAADPGVPAAPGTDSGQSRWAQLRSTGAESLVSELLDTAHRRGGRPHLGREPLTTSPVPVRDAEHAKAIRNAVLSPDRPVPYLVLAWDPINPNTALGDMTRRAQSAASQVAGLARVFVMPLAMPGMLTGTIIGMARALGESAPLLMIGMVAFIVDVPESPLDPATALPVQVYLWADSPERAFVERTSAAILVLLAFLLVMNATAILLRKRYERRW